MEKKRTYRHITLYEHADDYCAWPSILKLTNGELIVSFCRSEQHIAPNGQIALVRSKDKGLTWEKPRVIYDTVIDDRHCGLTLLDSGGIIANLSFHYWTRKGYDTVVGWGALDPAMAERWSVYADGIDPKTGDSLKGSRCIISHDDGYSFSPAIPAALPGDYIHGGVQLTDGSLMMAFGKDKGVGIYALTKLEDWSHSMSGALTSKAARVYLALRKKDAWEMIAAIKCPQPEKISFCEPSILRLPGGRIIVMMRANANPYDNTSPLCVLWESYSDDSGKTWAEPFPTPLWGFPPHLLLLSDGRVLCSYGYRKPPYGERACISEDGITWKKENEIVLRDDAPNDDLGYPASAELEPGRILTVYYQVNKAEVSPSPEYSRPSGEKPSILATIWTVS